MMMKRDRYFMNLAHKQALSASGAFGVYMGAVLAVKGRLLSFGQNQAKSHPFQSQFAKHEEAIFLHSETDAINSALRQISMDELCQAKTSLYIVRIKRSDGTNSPLVKAMAKPCVGCIGAIRAHNINQVMYTTNEFEVDILS